MFAAACMMMSCGPSRFVRPLDEGRTRYQVSTGVFRFDPESSNSSDGESIVSMISGASVGFGHGINDDLTAFTAIYPGFLFGGSLYLEMGAVAGILTPSGQGFGLSISPRTHFGLGFSEGLFRSSPEPIALQVVILPQLDLNVYYEMKSIRPFVGVGMFLPFAGSDDKISVEMTPMLHAGLALKSRTNEITIELQTNVQTINEVGSRRVGDLGLSVSISGR